MQKPQEGAAPEYLLSREVMEIARVSRRTLERWVADGTLIPNRLPGTRARRFRRSDVEALLSPTVRGDAA